MKWIFCVFLILKVNVECVNVFTAQNNTNGNPCTDENHLFLAPGVLTAGSSNRVCLSRFHPEGPARLMLTLRTEDKQIVTAIRELPTGDGGCVDILVPLLPNTKAQLFVNVRYPEARCSWDSKTLVRISSGRLVVAHTERARYRPRDTVRIRILTLKPELTPAHGYVEEIWLEAPRGVWEGTRAAYWHRVRTRFGIAQVQQELDGQAPTGKWTVRAKMADGSQGSADFWVGNYDLPPFQLSVRHSPRVLKSNERLVWTVCVRYPWTEGVEGMLVIRLRGAGGDGTSYHSGVRTAVRLRAPRACHRHAVASRRVGLDGANPPDVIVADFSFQEDGTRIWQNTTVVSEVIDKALFLEFLVKHNSDIPPGLPYNLKVKAIRWDDKPALNERVIVCRSPAKAFDTKTLSSNETCGTSVTDINGIARVIFEPDDDGSPLYKFEASLHNDSRISAPPLYLPVDRSSTIHAGLGALKWDMFAVRSYIPLYLNIRNISTPLTVHFVVVTRGGIIHKWGSTTQCPLGYSTNQVQSVSRNTHCDMARLEATQNDLNATSDTYDASDLTSDALYSRHSPRVMLSIKVTHQMCPDSHMIAYFNYNGHLVSASKHIEKEDCFVNKVEATWLSRQVLPGSMATLQLTTPGPAICALTALDTASKWIQPAPSLKEAILSGLRRLIDTHRNLTEYDVAGDCLIYEDTMDMPRNSIELTARRLATAGVKMVGSGLVERRKCEPRAPAPLRADEETPPRSDFSEAWLWRLVSVSSNGSTLTSARAPDSITRFEANAMCLTRHGVSISSPAVLQVYREFFIHADSPSRLRQGDVTIIRYRIFNYLYEPLSVQIQLITDSNLRATSDAVESVCIGARASVARRAEVRAERPGPAGSTEDALLRIRAKAVNDGNCNGTRARPGISDEVIIKLQVDPEGVPIQEYRSTLLCGKDHPESSSSDVSWAWPSVKSVLGTETLTVWAVADVTGPLFADADSLVLLPRGCGEQNMARLATNLLALTQLDPRSPQAAVSQKHVATGFTRQLQYLHPLGGFSAFGSSDSTPSTWLTAFSLRYLRKAHKMISPNLPMPPALEKAEKWLLNQQMENGCFRNEGQVFHRELKGGLEEDSDVASVALTAYVITSLIEGSISPPSRVLRNTLSCLRALPLFSTKSPSRVYAHALLAYAFMRLKRYEDELKSTNEASLLWEKKVNIGAGLQQDEEMKELLELLRMARRTNEYVWWETASLSTSIEATSYAILALSSCPRLLLETCARDARAATRWLCTHRNAAGGFVSTQDTLVALEALTAWSSVQPSLPANLTVTARSKSVKKIKLTSDTKVPELMKMGVADTLSVSVEGTGCALVQATRAFRSVAPGAPSSGSLGVKVSVHTDGPFDCDTSNTTCFCAAVVEACVLWSGMFPEMALLEVALPGGFGADAARLYSQLHEPNTLLRRIEMSTNSGRVTLYLGTADGSDAVARAGHQCYQIHAVGPQTKTKPAFARITDYYKTAINSTQMYTIPEECLPRINHEPEKYLTSDNLFIKSKSLDDNGEILISDEFSFEDIPEGIPLEDPLYDNLTQTDDKEKSGVKKKSLEVDNETRTIINETANGDNKTDDIDMVTQNVIIEEEDFQNQQVNLTYEPKIEINKTVNINVPSDSKIVALDDNLETTSKIEPLKESDNEVSKTLIGHKNELRNIATDSDQSLKIENPKLSDFHVINSETDLEVPTGIEGPVPVMVLPPQNFMNQQHQTELQTPRRRNNLGTLQTYFYTPFDAYYPPVRQNYYLRGFTN